MASEPIDTNAFTQREQLARIDQLLADAARKQQEIRLAPWALVASGLTAGAAIFAAGAAFMKLLT